MGPSNADQQILRMKAFPFSLEDKERSWLFAVPNGKINSWPTLVHEFLLKYFPMSRVTSLRKQITSIKQADHETFCEYYEHFGALVASCPAHGVTGGLLIQYFYEGLLPMEREFIDSTAGGSLLDLQLENANGAVTPPVRGPTL